MAETYGIFDYRSLPVELVATFTVGLRANSRVKVALSTYSVPLEQVLLAGVFDKLSFIAWTKTIYAESGSNRPKSVLQKLLGVEEEEVCDFEVFSSPEEFERKREALLKGGEDNGTN